MERDKAIREEVEKAFLALPPQEREAVISHGVALRLSDLRKRLFLAENKIRLFELRYANTLAEVEVRGLPDGADYEVHEDYVMWRHWAMVAEKAKRDIASLELIAQHGLYPEHVGLKAKLQPSSETRLEEVTKIVLGGTQAPRAGARS